MATIKERAQAYRKETEKSVFKSGMDISTMEFEYAYIQGATDQQKIDIKKARKAFCKAVCPNGCTYIKDGVESGCCLAVDCDKLESFVNLINN